jgi:hypothetical protein
MNYKAHTPIVNKFMLIILPLGRLRLGGCGSRPAQAKKSLQAPISTEKSCM